jgi:preprotein translocase subunit SecD
MWGRIATVLVALTAGAVICWLGWPPRLGIDLKGGLILVYEVDNSKQTAARVDDTVRRIEGMAATQDGAQGSVRRRAGGGVTVRLATPDERAREAFLATLTGAEFDRVAVREAGRRGSAGHIAWHRLGGTRSLQGAVGPSQALRTAGVRG